MTFDYTYISLLGFLFFEPMVLVTNLTIFVLSFFFFRNLIKHRHPYAQQMAWFILLLGVSTFFGAIGHTVHYQLGKKFFDSIILCMNASSFFSIYFLFRASYSYSDLSRKTSQLLVNGVLVWILIVLCISWLNAQFVFIKIHAGLVLLYALYVHYRIYLNSRERGNELLIFGILVSFLPIIVHSLHLSLHEWFNYKDLAHVLMIVSLIIIYKGLKLNVVELEAKQGV